MDHLVVRSTILMQVIRTVVSCEVLLAMRTAAHTLSLRQRHPGDGKTQSTKSDQVHPRSRIANASHDGLSPHAHSGSSFHVASQLACVVVVFQKSSQQEEVNLSLNY